ncbi:hypothetical protein K7432_004764 [Basidiobolus ranarum]|uniref:VPS9 domain-containing protein n=1 Tax=Basidiobolus ranarum TaxID=34480 RepID=A0ABR2WXL2_9FUNG
MPLKNPPIISVDHPLGFSPELVPEEPLKVGQDSKDSLSEHTLPTAVVNPEIHITDSTNEANTASTFKQEEKPNSAQCVNSNPSLSTLVEKSQSFNTHTNHVSISKVFLETPLSGLLSDNSVGQAILETLTNNLPEYEDIFERLMNKKAVLLLPQSPLSDWTTIKEIDRGIIENHVIVVQKWQRDSPIATLSGLKGYVQKEKNFLLDLNVPDIEEEISSDSSDTRRSIFGIFSKPKRMNKCINVRVRYANLYVAWMDGFVVASIIQNPISSEFQHIIPDLRTAHLEEEKPMVWDLLTKDMNRFIQKMQSRRNIPVQESVESFRKFIERASSTIENEHLSEKDEDQLIEWVERLLALELHPILFSPVSTDDQLKDQMLSSRIAALNIADLRLDHLGVTAEGEEHDHLMMMVEETGIELQRIDTIKAPADKIQVLVNCHHIITTSLDKYNQARASKGSSTTSSSADTILPLLIYTVVKSNPPNYVSNLRFIQRYRNPLKATQEYSYCLTNMMAVISFLENVDMVTLGLTSGAETSQPLLSSPVSDDYRVLSLPRNFGPLKVEKSDLLKESEERRNSLTDIKDGVETSMKAFSDAASNTSVVVGDGVRAITGVATGAVVGGSARALSGMVNLMGRFLYKESAQKPAFSVTSSQPLDESIAAEMASRLNPVDIDRITIGSNSSNSKVRLCSDPKVFPFTLIIHHFIRYP